MERAATLVGGFALGCAAAGVAVNAIGFAWQALVASSPGELAAALGGLALSVLFGWLAGLLGSVAAAPGYVVLRLALEALHRGRPPGARPLVPYLLCGAANGLFALLIVFGRPLVPTTRGEVAEVLTYLAAGAVAGAAAWWGEWRIAERFAGRGFA